MRDKNRIDERTATLEVHHFCLVIWLLFEAHTPARGAMDRCAALSCLLLGWSPPAASIDNGRGITPPRGWRSWDGSRRSHPPHPHHPSAQRCCLLWGRSVRELGQPDTADEPGRRAGRSQPRCGRDAHQPPRPGLQPHRAPPTPPPPPSQQGAQENAGWARRGWTTRGRTAARGSTTASTAPTASPSSALTASRTWLP